MVTQQIHVSIALLCVCAYSVFQIPIALGMNELINDLMLTLFSCLKSSSPVKNIFLWFNTVLPSSSPVEGLFGSVGVIETPRCNRLNESVFKKL